MKLKADVDVLKKDKQSGPSISDSKLVNEKEKDTLLKQLQEELKKAKEAEARAKKDSEDVKAQLAELTKLKSHSIVPPPTSRETTRTEAQDSEAAAHNEPRAGKGEKLHSIHPEHQKPGKSAKTEKEEKSGKPGNLPIDKTNAEQVMSSVSPGGSAGGSAGELGGLEHPHRPRQRASKSAARPSSASTARTSAAPIAHPGN